MRQSQSQEGGFNVESLPSGNQDGDNSDNDSGWSLGQILGVTIGGAAVAYMGVVLVGVVIWGVVRVRRRRRWSNPNSEDIPLVKKL